MRILPEDDACRGAGAENQQEVVAGIEQGPMPPDLDIEVEVSGMPKPKHTRMTTLKVESRGRAKFESGPLDFYANV